MALKRGGINMGDANGDTNAVAGSSRDVQGTSASPAVSMYATGSQVFFRMRLGATPITSGTELAPFAWGCVLDSDGKSTTYEYSVMVNGAVANDRVEFKRNATTTIPDSAEDPADATLLASYSAVTDNAVGTTSPHARVVVAPTAFGGATDQFLDFAVDQADFVAAGLNVAIPLRVACGSSSDATGILDDLAGASTSRALSGVLSDAVGVSVGGVAAYAAPCPAGKACFFMPAMLPIQNISSEGYSGDMIFAAPTQTAAVSYRLGSSATVNSLTVNAGTKQRVALAGGTVGFATGYGVAESRGVYVESDRRNLLAEQRMTATYWQSSSTIKSDKVSLGTRFRVAGYNLNFGNSGETDKAGWDFLSFYAPYATTVTVEAPASAPVDIWRGASRTVTIPLAAGQTYILRSKAGGNQLAAGAVAAPDIDGTLVTSTAPISLVVGGRGWGATPTNVGCAGDEGADGVVPMKYVGTEYVTTTFSGTSNQDVRVVADENDTVVTVNGVTAATLSAGQTHKFTPSNSTYIQTSKPAAVFQNASKVACENDIAFLPPLALANIASQTYAFDVLG
ncbi:MAG: IgGFc-binding protein, partial [Deltaproteobacteria bacterium]|nr:IgGFc-binding protein [Deltaproteobacteria bacterium]